jgi:uridine phosphorylase
MTAPTVPPPAARRAAFPWQDGRPPHLPCGPGDVGPVVLLPGDPARVGLAARLLPGARDLGQRREFRMATAEVDGVAVTLCSTGIGGPSTEIALVELANLGARVAIRIGGMGAIAPGLPLGGMLVVDEAMGATGAARVYGGGGLVKATPAVVAALAAAAEADGTAHRVGRVATTDSYYRGQGRPLFGDAAGPDPDADPVARFAAAGALGCDMETETVFAVGRALGLQVGAVLAVHGDRVGDRWLEDYEPAQAAVVRIAVAAALALPDLRTTE